MLVGVVLLMAIETPRNEAFSESMKWMFVPITLLCMAFTLKYIERIRIQTGWKAFRIWFFTFLMVGILTFFSWPYVLLFNVLTVNSPATPVEIGGRVEHKFESGTNKSRSFVLVTRSERLGRTISLKVPKAKYQITEIGDSYSECFFVGSLGFFFRFRQFNSALNCSTAASRIP